MYTHLFRNEWKHETPEEEWNFLFNNKRVSIEALDAIELKQKGNGPIKAFYNSEKFTCGPCYDPGGVHVHIWKKDSLIKNFIGEQNPIITYVQFTEYKKGTYCCICHKSVQKFHMKWRKEPDSCDVVPNVRNDYKYKPEDCIKDFVNFDNTIQEKKVSIAKKKWKSALYKVNYILKNDKIVYPVSKYKSILLWPWELTPYQRFKINIPDYKQSIIFVKNNKEKFKNNYAIIE
jgi:hypothetical protein